ncbi:hypothetical protein HK405_011353, partial [Cladochytrium tenue]
MFVTKTSLCSTVLTQNSAVLNFVHWRHVARQRVPIETIIGGLLQVPEVELVKFLKNVLDAIFEIMDDPDANAEHKFDDLLFNALVFTLGVVVDRRFIPFGAVIDNYVDRDFTSLTCWRNLTTSFLRLLRDPTRKEPRDAIKVWGYWIKFIVRSGLSSARANVPSEGGPSFTDLLGEVLLGIERMMSMSTPEAIGAQTLALQHFPQLIPDLAGVYGPADLVSSVVGFTDSVRGSKV